MGSLCRTSPTIVNATRAKGTLVCKSTGGQVPGERRAEPDSAIFALLNSTAQHLQNNNNAQQTINSSRPDTCGLGYRGLRETTGFRTEAAAHLRPRAYRISSQ